MDWMKLKSGSDVRGVAVGENAPLTEHVAMCLGMAFARYVAKHVGKPVTQVTIAIGRDSRISGPALLHAAAEGVSKAGASVLDFGMCTTPAMYMCIITPGFQPDGSIMITASHHPYDKNGLKWKATWWRNCSKRRARSNLKIPRWQARSCKSRSCRRTRSSLPTASAADWVRMCRSRCWGCTSWWTRATAQVDSMRS